MGETQQLPATDTTVAEKKTQTPRADRMVAELNKAAAADPYNSLEATIKRANDRTNTETGSQ